MIQSIFTGYIDSALAYAEYDKLEDGTYSGRIPVCKGVVTFGNTLRSCEKELQSTLEDWIFVGIKLGHQLPNRLSVPSNLEYSTPQLKMMMNEVESIIGRRVTADEWNNLA